MVEENEEPNNETVPNDTADNQDDDKVVTLTFTYNNITYSVELSSKELGVDLNDYAYYIVRKNGEILELYYTKERIKATARGGSVDNYKTNLGENPILVKIDTKGSLEKNILNNQEPYIEKTKLIASNQNVYYYNTIIFERNSGYIYHSYGEMKEEIVSQIVKPENFVSDLNIYEGPALNYDIIATVPNGSMFKRVIENVNIANGYVWDKVQLNNGVEGYAISSEINYPIEKTAEGQRLIEKIKIPYQDKIYETYFELSNLGDDFYEYKYYYAVLSDDLNKISIYYSKTEIQTRKYSTTLYETTYGDNTIKFEIDMISGISKYSILPAGYTRHSRSKYIITNHINTAEETLCLIGIYDSILEVIYQEGVSIHEIDKSEEIIRRITEGENLYNSMSPSERKIKGTQLLETETIAIELATASMLLIPNASKALLYYLTEGNSDIIFKDKYIPWEIEPYKEGHRKRLIDIQDELIGEKFNEIINAVINTSENIQGLKDGKTIMFSNTIEANGMVTKNYNIDWHETVNNYRIRTQNIVSKNNDSYNLKLTLEIEDYYDWERGSIYEDWQKIAINELYDMNRAGLARNYTNFGELNYDIQWLKGQRVESGNVVIKKGNNELDE